MRINALVPWFGSNRANADQVGRQIGKVAWCGVPFVGGCCEIPHIATRAGVANDRHRLLINLARHVADPDKRAALFERVDRALFHPVELREAQDAAITWENGAGLFARGGEVGDLDAAAGFFIATWMGRSAMAGQWG